MRNTSHNSTTRFYPISLPSLDTPEAFVPAFPRILSKFEFFSSERASFAFPPRFFSFFPRPRPESARKLFQSDRFRFRVFTRVSNSFNASSFPVSNGEKIVSSHSTWPFFNPPSLPGGKLWEITRLDFRIMCPKRWLMIAHFPNERSVFPLFLPIPRPNHQRGGEDRQQITNPRWNNATSLIHMLHARFRHSQNKHNSCNTSRLKNSITEPGP